MEAVARRHRVAAKSIAESARWLDAYPVGPEQPSDLPKLRADAADLLEHLEAGRGWGFWPIRPAVVKRTLYIRDLRIGGRQCNTAETARDLLRLVAAQQKAASLRERWAPHHAIRARTFIDLATELQDLCEPIRDALTALNMKEALSAILRRTPGVPEPEWSDPDSLFNLRETLAAVETTGRYEAARARIAQPLENLGLQRQRGSLDPASEDMEVAVKQRNASAYAAARQHAAAHEPLIPLRRYGAGRLEPTVAARHVRDGYQNGVGARSVNPPEAEALVKEIVRVCSQPAYADKTIGVISLVGEAQARDIETRLIRQLDPEEYERRQIVCGDAYAFQGDERDVMFLSMVLAPHNGRRIRALTDANTQRRFNVAASRAKDQLYLFHTATLADLNPNCMRYRLLDYCLDRQVALPDVAGLDLPELERLAVRVDREPGNQPEPFESWFELDVLNWTCFCASSAAVTE